MRGSTARAALPVVEDRQRRQVDDLPARPPDPQAEVDLLGVDEEPLVEAAGVRDRLAADEHERADRPVALELRVVAVEAHLALAEPARPVRKPLEAERVAERARDAREPPHRRLHGAVRPELAHAGEADLGPPVELGDELGQRARQHLGVGVQEEDVARVDRPERLVVRVAEAVVLAGDDARVRVRPLDERLRLARGAVVDDDDVERERPGVLEARSRRQRGSHCAWSVETTMTARSCMGVEDVTARRVGYGAASWESFAATSRSARPRGRAGSSAARAARAAPRASRRSSSGRRRRCRGRRCSRPWSGGRRGAWSPRRARCGSTSAPARTGRPAG